MNPASYSIIADYFPPQRRAFAMAILMLGGSLGMMLGFVGGGLIAERYSWRIALVSVGLPGLLLAAFMAKYLREPVRGTFEAQSSEPPPPILATAAAMWHNPAMRHLIAGAIIAGLVGYGFTQWLPTFFMRAHDLSQSETGMMMAGVFGILGAIGALVAGKMFDRLSRRGFEHGMRMLAWVPFATISFFILAILAEEFAIHDYEGFEAFGLGEYASIESVHAMAEFIQEYPDIAGELLNHFGGSLDDATKAAEEQYAGCYKSLADYAQELTEQSTDIPESLAFYIDYEKMGCDMELGGDVFTIETGYNEVHIFWAH